MAVCLGLSMVLCGASLLLFSINHAKAEATVKPAPWDENVRGAVGLGIDKNTGYFVVFGRPGNAFYKVDLTKAKDWYSE